MASLFFGVRNPTLDLQEDLQIADSDARASWVISWLRHMEL